MSPKDGETGGMEREARTGLPSSEEARPAVEAEIVSLWEVVNELRQELAELRQGQRQELVELRMGQRKAVLEELAWLEKPLVEQGVLEGRTRPPRHRRDES